jgi:hypothetical protein
MIFLVSGLVALTTLVLLAISTVSAVPVAAVSWPLTIYAGYRIWRADHPAASFWRALARRSLAVATFGATAITLLFIRESPQVLVVVVAIWLLAMVTLLVLLTIVQRSTPDA